MWTLDSPLIINIYWPIHSSKYLRLAVDGVEFMLLPLQPGWDNAARCSNNQQTKKGHETDKGSPGDVQRGCGEDVYTNPMHK